MHSSVQYMMVKMMVHNRNAERVDFDMMMIFFNILWMWMFSHIKPLLLDNNDVVNLCFFMWRESWTADWGRASEMPTVNCFLLLVTSIAISVLWQGDKSVCCQTFCSILLSRNWCKRFSQNLFWFFFKKIFAFLPKSDLSIQDLVIRLNHPILNWHEEPWAIMREGHKKEKRKGLFFVILDRC